MVARESLGDPVWLDRPSVAQGHVRREPACETLTLDPVLVILDGTKDVEVHAAIHRCEGGDRVVKVLDPGDTTQEDNLEGPCLFRLRIRLGARTWRDVACDQDPSSWPELAADGLGLLPRGGMYYTVLSAQAVLARHGLRLLDVEELPTHGGSIRLWVVHRDDPRPTTTAVEELLSRERAAGLDLPGGYSGFAERVESIKRDLLAFLIEERRRGSTIAGYGAPGKANTLLNFCGIRTDLIEYLVDRNPYKHGRFTPGTRIPIFAPDHLRETRPDVILIMAGSRPRRGRRLASGRAIASESRPAGRSNGRSTLRTAITDCRSTRRC